MHLMVDQCLACKIVTKIIEDGPGFQDQVKELEKVYTLMETDKALTPKKNELAGTSKTSALWINYQRMVGISRAFVAADRMGSLEMHLRTISA